MSFEVNVCQNVRVVFVKYMIQMYKKKLRKMKSFMVVKSFTLPDFFMNGKEKQEIEKRTLL